MYIMITTTSDSKKILDTISKEIFNKKLSPCIQFSQNIFSQYIWKDEIEKDDEFKIDIKTHSIFEKDIVSIIEKMHNYDVPEIISFNIKLLNAEYEKWFKNNIKS